MKKKVLLIIPIVILIIFSITLVLTLTRKNEQTSDFISVKSKSELEKIYKGSYDSDYDDNILTKIVTMPFSLLEEIGSGRKYYYGPVDYMVEDLAVRTQVKGLNVGDITATNEAASSSKVDSVSSDFSTTNIQVENVDEADIIKTDGNYIYSLSDDKVIITDAKDPANLKIVAKIQVNEDGFIPEDMIIYKNRLVIIATNGASTYNSDTIVNVVDISDKSKPSLLEEFRLHSSYYTSRCIDGKLLIITNGMLRKDDDEIITYYEEENEKKEIDLSNIKYLKDVKTRNQTLIASYDLNKAESVSVKSYLFNAENAYISENNMYILEEKYESENEDEVKVSDLYGPGGIIGFFVKIINTSYDYSYDQNTHIYKFNIEDDGNVKYDCKTKVTGTTINQFSLDEYKGNLRVGLYTTDGSRIAVFDKNLKLLGETSYLSKGEKMYSTRFIGDRAYMVTYKNTDPLYVIDLSKPSKPTVLGKLKIPGYSTYLHPYDENHLIGIGMQTEEKVYRDINGKVTRTTATITGMKMAIFDVTDVNNPKQISQIEIGDSRTTSAILTNHKALLFSKEKGIIAIPVNNYADDVSISTTSDNVETIINSYKNYGKKYVAEGYFVYDISLEEGFKLKGQITHEKQTSSYTYRNTSRLLRGLWIDNNLFTVSEDMIKVNKLDTLEEVGTMKIDSTDISTQKTNTTTTVNDLVNTIKDKATDAASFINTKAQEGANIIENKMSTLENKLDSLLGE